MSVEVRLSELGIALASQNPPLRSVTSLGHLFVSGQLGEAQFLTGKL
jgi:hypothetical protein